VKIDHLQAIKSKQYAARIRKRLCGLSGKGGFNIIDVFHEDDGSCCKTQAWPITFSHLAALAIAEVAVTDADSIQAQMAEHEPSIILVSKPK
jgi:hypothetical protein